MKIEFRLGPTGQSIMVAPSCRSSVPLNERLNGVCQHLCVDFHIERLLFPAID